MKKTLLTLLIMLSSLSALAGDSRPVKQDDLNQQTTFLLTAYDSSQSLFDKEFNKTNRWPGSNNSCISSCRFQFQLCNAYNLYPNCQIRLERCVEDCFN